MRARSSRHLAALPLACAALLAVLSACSRPAEAGSRPTADSGAEASAKKVLHFGNGTEPSDLDPHLVTGVSEHNILTALFEGLVTDPPSGEGAAPGVAESWESSPDGLVWTFRLRPDARWSDGTPLTAEDFLRAYRRILTPSLAAHYAYKLFHVVGAEEYHRGQLADFAATGFAAPDPHTLVLRLKHRVPYLLEALKHYSWFPVPLHVIERHGPADRPGNPWTRPGRLVGNGPFVLDSWKPDQAITVSRSPGYWNASAVRLYGIAFHAVSDQNTEERMFRAGQLHVTYTLPADKIDAWRRRAPEQLRIEPYYGTYFYRINTTRPPLDDVRVRRALALAIDRRVLVENVTRGGQDPAPHFTPPLAGFTPADTLPAASAETLAEARRLLAEAGYPGGRGLRRLEIL